MSTCAPTAESTREGLARLWAAVDTYDGEVADATLADLIRERSLGEAVTTIVLPFLEEIGSRWQTDRLSVAHEHFASNLVRRWLSAFSGPTATEVVPSGGPVILLACPPGERHDLVLLCFSLLLAEDGARTRYLGADTPMPALAAAARAAGADAVVLASTRDTAFAAEATSIANLALEHPVFVAGRGASQSVAEELRAHLLPHDPVVAVGFLRTVLAGGPSGS